jgi:hypothetical protein
VRDDLVRDDLVREPVTSPAGQSSQKSPEKLPAGVAAGGAR